jgi:plastocyanin
MHTLAMQLSPVMAAENSKVPFYVAGGVLVAWALFVSLALGLRNPRFPGGPSGERAVMAISGVLVLAAIVTAVTTAGGSTAESKPAVTSAEPAPAPNPAAGSGAASQPASTPAAPAAAAPAAATPGGSGAATSLKLAANPTGLLAFDTKQLSGKAGAVEITLTNSSPIEHDVAVALGSSVLGTTPTFTGGSKKLTLNLKPGTYTFYCTVPGHRQGGMEGTLKVS